MRVETLCLKLSEESQHMLQVTMQAAPVTIHIDSIYMPLMTRKYTGHDFGGIDPGLRLSLDPIGFSMPFNTLNATSYLLIQMQSQEVREYRSMLYREYDAGSPFIHYYGTKHGYSYAIVQRLPPLSQMFRGWAVNMSTTLNQSIPDLIFDRPYIHYEDY